jgi:hypothetical protein|tara:strand:- start:516 stop:1013 length:498 start_codon:yes stop_codon:yes gene_type:complete
MVKQAKKNGKNQEEVAPPAEAVAVTYLPPTEAQWKVMKMRNRDILDANKKMIDMELKAQAEALEADEKNRGMVTFSAYQANLMVIALEATLMVFASMCSDVVKAKSVFINLKKDFGIQVARLNGLIDGTVKAMTPAEKKANAEALQEKMAAAAKLEAEIAALSQV